MPPEIKIYSESMLGPEATVQLENAFSAMMMFNSVGDLTAYMNIIFSYGNVEPFETQEQIYAQVNIDLDRLINEHLIFHDKDSTIEQKTEILKALYYIGEMEYDSLLIFLPMIESEMSSVDKLVELLTALTILNPVVIMESIDRVEDVFIEAIRAKAYSLERNIHGEKHDSETVDELRVLAHYLSKRWVGKNPIGLTMISKGFNSGLVFDEYLSFIRDYLRSNIDRTDEEIILDCMSLCVMSRDGLPSMNINLSKMLDYSGIDQAIISRIVIKSGKILSDYIAYKAKEIEGVKS